MSESTTVLVPPQRLPETPCPSWCQSDHHGELPGQRSHWAPIETMQLALTPLQLIDLSQVDGLEPLVILHDSVGGHVPLSLDEAEAYAVAILTAVIRARAAVAR